MCLAQRATINCGLPLTRGAMAVCSAGKWCTSAALLTPPALMARTLTDPSLCPTAPVRVRIMNGMSWNEFCLLMFHLNAQSIFTVLLYHLCLSPVTMGLSWARICLSRCVCLILSFLETSTPHQCHVQWAPLITAAKGENAAYIHNFFFKAVVKHDPKSFWAIS